MQTNIIEALARQFRDYKLHYSLPQRNVVMSSVAIIIRANPKVQTKMQANDIGSVLSELKALEEVFAGKHNESFYEILFLQRAMHHRDSNPGHLCFPGGKCDPGEPDIDAAIRETTEETAIELNKKMLLGKVPRAFFARQSKANFLFLTAYLFLQVDPQPITLNTEEVIDYRWVPLDKLLAPKEHITTLNIAHPAFLLPITEQLAKEHSISVERIEDAFEGIEFPALDLGMSFPLFGLTFYVWIDIASHILRICQQQLGGAAMHLRQLIDAASILQVNFHKDFELREVLSRRVAEEYKRFRILPSLNASRL